MLAHDSQKAARVSENGGTRLVDFDIVNQHGNDAAAVR